ncbi:AAA family ATPase, partial [Phocaeicola vulgatus]|nr:AAA family ATPase [Phocaeicola vulgatus]
MCVSRPRRFGKSMAANMLAAYYDREENTQNLFDKLLISQTESYKEHLNQYDVIRINMQQFLSITNSADEMLELLQERILRELERK